MTNRQIPARTDLDQLVAREAAASHVAKYGCTLPGYNKEAHYLTTLITDEHAAILAANNRLAQAVEEADFAWLALNAAGTGVATQNSARRIVDLQIALDDCTF